MSDPLRTDPTRANEPVSEADREAKIEQLLLSGLDHYFAGQLRSGDQRLDARAVPRPEPRPCPRLHRARPQRAGRTATRVGGVAAQRRRRLRSRRVRAKRGACCKPPSARARHPTKRWRFSIASIALNRRPRQAPAESAPQAGGAAASSRRRPHRVARGRRWCCCCSSSRPPLHSAPAHSDPTGGCCSNVHRRRSEPGGAGLERRSAAFRAVAIPRSRGRACSPPTAACAMRCRARSGQGDRPAKGGCRSAARRHPEAADRAGVDLVPTAGRQRRSLTNHEVSQMRVSRLQARRTMPQLRLRFFAQLSARAS